METPAAARGKEIRALTGLRGVAALWVAIYHYNIATAGAVPLIGTVFVSHGYLAVDVFFVLSGFLLTLSYGHLFQHGFDPRRYGAYLWRRLARVYPVYILATLLVFTLGLVRHRYALLDAVPLLVTNVLLIESWGFAGPVVGAAWSLSVEFAAYLLFPLLLLLFWQSRPSVAIVAGLVCMAIPFWLATLRPLDPEVVKRGLLDVFWGHSLGPMVRGVAAFSLGIVAFRVSNAPRFASVLRSGLTAGAVAVAILGAAALPDGDIAVALLAPVLVACLATGRGWVAAVLGSATCVWLGEVSYSLYLFHQGLLRVGIETERLLIGHLGTGLAGLGGLTAAMGTTLLVAWACYHWVERPARSALVRLAG